MSIAPLQRTAPDAPAAPSAAGAQRPAAPTASKPSPYVQFEAFVLQSFIQAIMPQNATEVFGQGTAGEVWKSMLAEKIALQVAEAGGVGIAKMIAPKDAGGTATASTTGVSAGVAARVLDMQLAGALGTPGSTGGKTSE